MNDNFDSELRGSVKIASIIPDPLPPTNPPPP